MTWRKTGILSLAIYSVIYICLLVPGHLAQYSAGGSDLGRSFDQSDSCCRTHDSRTCQICLTGGQQAAVLVMSIVDVELHTVETVIFDIVSRTHCLHVDHISSRAPPLPV